MAVETNTGRADRALVALAAHVERIGDPRRMEWLSDVDVFDEVVGDLLADLAHLARLVHDRDCDAAAEHLATLSARAVRDLHAEVEDDPDGDGVDGLGLAS